MIGWVERGEDTALQLTGVVNTIAGRTDAPIRLSILLISLLVSGCWSRAEIDWPDQRAQSWTNANPEIERSAFESMAAADRSHLDGAWVGLANLPFEARLEATIADENGATVGRQSRRLALVPEGTGWSQGVVSADSSGSFERSFWSRFSAFDEGPLTEGGFAALALPEDPLFLAEQGPSYFRYRPAGDTLIGGARIDVFESMTRPETVRPGVQWARMYVSGDDLVGIDVTFVQQSFLYQERTDFRILLQPIDDTWLPAHVRIRSIVGVPFSRGRAYTLQIDYLDLDSAQEAAP